MKDSYLGRIAVFDERRGLGEVEAAGGLRYPFHCTAIHDGSRFVAEAPTSSSPSSPGHSAATRPPPSARSTAPPGPEGRRRSRDRAPPAGRQRHRDLGAGVRCDDVQPAPPGDRAVDEAEAHRMVHRVLEAGVNLIDTADAYDEGRSEEILGRAIKGRRDDVVIATKCGFGSVGRGPGGLGYDNVIDHVRGEPASPRRRRDRSLPTAPARPHDTDRGHATPRSTISWPRGRYAQWGTATSTRGRRRARSRTNGRSIGPQSARCRCTTRSSRVRRRGSCARRPRVRQRDRRVRGEPAPPRRRRDRSLPVAPPRPSDAHRAHAAPARRPRRRAQGACGGGTATSPCVGDGGRGRAPARGRSARVLLGNRRTTRSSAGRRARDPAAVPRRRPRGARVQPSRRRVPERQVPRSTEVAEGGEGRARDSSSARRSRRRRARAGGAPRGCRRA